MKQYLVLFLLVCTTSIYSQSTTSIKGKLIDKEYNDEALAFGTVSIKGTINETTADIDGLYIFENLRPGEYVLEYSFVGYETQEIKVNVSAEKTTEINVVMEARSLPLNQVVSTTTANSESDTSLIYN